MKIKEYSGLWYILLRVRILDKTDKHTTKAVEQIKTKNNLWDKSVGISEVMTFQVCTMIRLKQIYEYEPREKNNSWRPFKRSKG
jgi:hypothetical protein